MLCVAVGLFQANPAQRCFCGTLHQLNKLVDGIALALQKKKAKEQEIKPQDEKIKKVSNAITTKPAQKNVTAPIVSNATTLKNATTPAPAVPIKKDPITSPKLETVQKNSSAVKLLAQKPD